MAPGGGLAGQQRHMRHPAHMPQLQEDTTAGSVHRIGDPAPAGHLFGAVDTRRRQIALAHGADLRAFGHDQSGTGALSVVIGGDRRRHVAGIGPVTGQGRHDDAVGQGDGAQMQGLKQGMESGCGQGGLLS